MGDLRFSCPHCNQAISCDELWGGHQLQCPSCQREVTVPQKQASSLVPAPPPVAQPKLSLGRPQAQHAAAPGNEPPKPKPVYREFVAPVEKKGGVMKWVTITLVVVALGVGGYFGFGWLSAYQEKVNTKRREVEKNSDGGEMGHIANVYDVLDKTDPDRYEKSGGKSREGVPRQPRSGVGKPLPGAAGSAEGDATQPAEKELPVIPAIWTLEVATARIPDGKANGKISGTNFVVQTASLGIVGNAHVLSLRQGAAASPDREILVYLHPKPGEALAGYTLTISKDMKGSGVPQVAKRWKTNPKFAPTLKTFAAGYAMKLELGQISDGEISGKIFIALPDAEQSVVAGAFKATTLLPPTANPAAPTPVGTPAPTVNPEFEKRYGTKR